MKKVGKNGLRPLEGRISKRQLRNLITKEAQELGLTFDEAVERAKERKLPRSYLGDDLALLIDLLPA